MQPPCAVIGLSSEGDSLPFTTKCADPSAANGAARFTNLQLFILQRRTCHA
jgi:hypothetical protein